jgi:hypothetical protein
LIDKESISANAFLEARISLVDPFNVIVKLSYGTRIAARRDLPQNNTAITEGAFDAIQPITVCVARPRRLLGSKRCSGLFELLGGVPYKRVPLIFWGLVVDINFATDI